MKEAVSQKRPGPEASAHRMQISHCLRLSQRVPPFARARQKVEGSVRPDPDGKPPGNEREVAKDGILDGETSARKQRVNCN